jgi:hypothetical protein
MATIFRIPSGLRDFWSDFGGLRAQFATPYFWAAVVASAALYPLWTKPGWWQLALDMIPSLLGFSLGGFAIFLAFSNERFLSLIAGNAPDDKNGELSPYIQFANPFMHFIVVQLAALGIALFALSMSKISPPIDTTLQQWNEAARFVLWGFGFLLLTYSMFTALAATAGIYDLVKVFDAVHTDARSKPAENADHCCCRCLKGYSTEEKK